VILSHLINLDDNCITQLATYCGILNKIELDGCRQLTDSCVKKFTALCPLLEKINLRACVQMTDAAIEALAQNCRLLQYLDVSFCTNLTDQSIYLIAQNCKDLESLFVKRCVNLTTEGVKFLARGCGISLKCLDFDGLMIDDKAVQQLTISCPMLVDVDLSFCRQVSFQAVLHLINTSPFLESISIFGLKLTLDMKKQITRNHPRLNIKTVPIFD